MTKEFNKKDYMAKKVKDTFGDIEVLNITEKMKQEIYTDVAKINQKVIANIAKDLEKGDTDMDAPLDIDEFNKSSKKVIAKTTKEMEKLFSKFLLKLTNIPKEVIEDKEIMDLPSEDLSKAITLVSEMVSSIVDEYNKIVSEVIKQK